MTDSNTQSRLLQKREAEREIDTVSYCCSHEKLRKWDGRMQPIRSKVEATITSVACVGKEAKQAKEGTSRRDQNL